MKVGLIVPGGVDRSGIERTIPIFLWLIERLTRWHEVHVFALRQEPRPSTYQLLGATVHNIGLRPRRVRTLNAITREHARGRFDVLHAFWAVPQGVIGAAAARALGVPLLLDVIGGDLADLADLHYGNARTRRGRAWLRFAVNTATRATTASEFMQRLARAYGLELERLPLGIALDRWPRTPPRATRQDPARLLHVGSINQVKDQDTLLRAAQALRDRGGKFQLDIVGLDTLDGRLQARAGSLG
ncbi:MAG TPA: glycosyltransferase, partial [Longimicrobiales bacterium]|nr:glycosyltransferase [Longimicrobiales bacterium]